MRINNYPLIFKQTVVNKYNKKDTSINNILSTFKISNGTLYNWKNNDKNNKLTEKKKYTKYSKYLPHIKGYIRNYVITHVCFNMNKLILLLKKKYDLIAKKSSLYNIIKNFDISHKKIRKKFVYGKKKDHAYKIKTFKNQIKKLNIGEIISIDEVSVDTHTTNNYGWGLKGKRIIKIIRKLRKRFTIICAITNNKILYYKIIKGSADANLFLEFIKKLNVTNKYILMDNARIHHSHVVMDYITSTSNKIIFNVPYSPEFNPIEIIFSKFKSKLRKLENSTVSKLIKNIDRSFSTITQKDIINSYNKCLLF